QASAERLLQASDVRDLPEGLPRGAGDGRDRARQRHVGLGLSAPRRHLAVLAEGDRGAVPRRRPRDPAEDALGERAAALSHRLAWGRAGAGARSRTTTWESPPTRSRHT